MELLIFTTLVLAAGNILCGLAILGQLRQEPKAPPDPLPQRETAESAPAEGPRPLRLDEGIENLMAYQVKLGRGRTTGGEAE